MRYSYVPATIRTQCHIQKYCITPSFGFCFQLSLSLYEKDTSAVSDFMLVWSAKQHTRKKHHKTIIVRCGIACPLLLFIFICELCANQMRPEHTRMHKHTNQNTTNPTTYIRTHTHISQRSWRPLPLPQIARNINKNIYWGRAAYRISDFIATTTTAFAWFCDNPTLWTLSPQPLRMKGPAVIAQGQRALCFVQMNGNRRVRQRVITFNARPEFWSIIFCTPMTTCGLDCNDSVHRMVVLGCILTITCGWKESIWPLSGWRLPRICS